MGRSSNFSSEGESDKDLQRGSNELGEFERPESGRHSIAQLRYKDRP